MKKTTIKIQFSEEKLKALKISLKKKNKNFDDEIIKIMNDFYKKNVPKVLQNFIAESEDSISSHEKM